MAKPPFVVGGGVSIQGVRVGVPSPAGHLNPLFASGVDFDRDEFDALLANKGYLVTWERAAYCPNRPRGSVAPLSHEVNCSVCDGSGFVFFSSCETEMLIQAVRLNQHFYSQGRWDVGSILVTARPGLSLNSWDRITLRNGVGRFTELMLRQPSGDDRPKYTPLCVEYAAWVGRDGKIQVFDPRTDLDVKPNGFVSWKGSRPDGNSYYTISYTYRPRYVVQELLHKHRDSSVDDVRQAFPVEAVAKEDFLVRDESRDSSMVVADEGRFKFP